MAYIDKPLSEYLNDLASRKAAPGGGSAAALEASIGCSLISMVLNFTLSNKKYEPVRDRASADLSRVEELRKQLTSLIDQDVTAYGELSRALKSLDKDSPKLEPLFEEACNVPFLICKASSDALDICDELVKYGNKNLVTDTAIAALMLESAFFGAKFNVYINLHYIQNDEYVGSVHKYLSESEERIPELKEKILHQSEEIARVRK